MKYLSLQFVAGSQWESLRWLEPYDAKVSRTVPRGADSYD